MKYIHTKGLDLSRFMLGTVQLGMEYGLGSDRAKPSYQKAFAMLDQAAALGINAFDTANNYGDAEYILGQWLEKRYRNPGVRPWIVTKIGPLKDEAFDNLRDDVRRQVDDCRWNLGVETIDCLMLHNYEDYEAHGKAIQRIFAELRGEHAFRYSAISAYSRHDYGVIAESGFDAVQIPLNIFDWGQIESGGIEKLAKGMASFYGGEAEVVGEAHQLCLHFGRADGHSPRPVESQHGELGGDEKGHPRHKDRLPSSSLEQYGVLPASSVYWQGE